MLTHTYIHFTQEDIATLSPTDERDITLDRCTFDSLETMQQFFSVISPKAEQLTVCKDNFYRFSESQRETHLSVLRGTNVSTLVISNFYFSDDLIGLTKELKGTNVTTLDASYNGIKTPEALTALMEGLSGTKVTILNLSGNNIITPEALTALTEGLRDTNVTTLNLSGNDINTPEALTGLTEGLRGTNVTTLNLSENDINTPEALTALIEGLRGTNVTTLNLSGNGIITPEALTALTKGLSGTKVTTLDLSNSFVVPNELKGMNFSTQDGCGDYIIPAAQRTYEYFANCMMSPKALTALTEGLRDTNVTTLNLSGSFRIPLTLAGEPFFQRCFLSTAAFTALTEGLKDTNVSTIDLSDNSIQVYFLKELLNFAKSHRHITNIILDDRNWQISNQLRKNQEASTIIKEGMPHKFPKDALGLIGEYDGDVPVSKASWQAHEKLGVDKSFASSLMQSKRDKVAVAGPLSVLDRAKAVSHSSHAL